MPLPAGLSACAARGMAALALVLAPSPAVAMTAAELSDVAPDHWAYKAIQQLTERYGVMDGYPDGTFRGTRTVTRYELAAALTRVMQKVSVGQAPAASASPQAAAAAPPASASPEDRATLEKLRVEFKQELTALEGRVKASEESLKGLQGKLGKMLTLKGRVDSVLGDELLDVGKDRTAPYVGSTLALTLAGKVSEATSYDAAIGGAIKASGSGDVPAVMAGALGRTPTADTISLRSARVTSKVGAATINLGRFPLWLVGFGPYSDQAFRTNDFLVGVGSLAPDASALRVGSDVGITVDAPLGPLKVMGGLNSNIIAAQLGGSMGLVSFKAGFETDHKAITQQLLNTPQRVKTTYNTAAVLDVGGEGPVGGTLQLNVTNDALTQVGGGVRGSIAGIDLNAVVVSASDPGRSVDVLSYGAVVGLPAYAVLGGRLTLPTVTVAMVDNFTWNAPARADRRETTGPGGQALGKNAGLSIQLGLENPLIPGLVVEYNAQAKLIEDIFLPNDQDPITSESLLFKSTMRF
ncbi:MAG: S-layer homology domain-containing protein [Candidatus Sericytochromatia bacterium]|nr:S-layer homology domain-containing protein [Candidatus Sericytochromatia bacterium]